jgi:tetratricopeptide (TPR) repeat protein
VVLATGQALSQNEQTVGRAFRQIFISYRRSDSADMSGRISDYLTNRFRTNRFRKDRVFQDVDDIPPGRRWDETIDAAIRASDVVLVVIGPSWSSVSTERGRRLDDPDDELRREVSTTLIAPGTQVIPLLVGDAKMPSPEDLPEDLKTLSRRQAFEIRGGDGFRADMDRLVAELPTSTAGRSYAIAGAAGVVLISFAVLLLGLLSADDDASPVDTPAPPATSTIPATDPAPEPDSSEPELEPEPESSSYRETKLKGSFNVAVAAFRAVSEANDALVEEAQDAATQLEQNLRSRFSSVNVDVATDVGLYARPDNLADLLEMWDAHIVVSATLESLGEARGHSSKSVFDVEFVLRSAPFARSDHVVGSYELGEPLEFNGSFDSVIVRDELRDTTERRVCILAHLLEGVSAYREGPEYFDQARVSLLASAEADGCDDREARDAAEGREIAYLFLANIDMIDGHLKAAGKHFEDSLRLNPDFTRARFGLAEVKFQQALTECEASPKAAVAQLREALQLNEDALSEYDRAIDDGRVPATPYIRTQARVQRGRIELCLAFATGTGQKAATRAFEDAISDYGEFDPSDEWGRLSDLTAEAHAGLAVIAIGIPDLAKARTHLNDAIELATHNERLARFYALRAQVNDALGKTADGKADCDNAKERAREPIECQTSNPISFVNEKPLPETGSRELLMCVIATALIAIGLYLRRFARRVA